MMSYQKGRTISERNSVIQSKKKHEKKKIIVFIKQLYERTLKRVWIFVDCAKKNQSTVIE